VDLDAELTPRGWAKNKRLWTVDKVESVSRDVMAGLKFLHEHHIVHGDLKPSNFMRDPRTGFVKLIDLGASRRWVRLHNIAKERTSAVEELDQAVKEGFAEIPKAGLILCEGLGSLTGSPQ
jgi:serine/threonine protein kinase